jgi:hypothetical protein
VIAVVISGLTLGYIAGLGLSKASSKIENLRNMMYTNFYLVYGGAGMLHVCSL